MKLEDKLINIEMRLIDLIDKCVHTEYCEDLKNASTALKNISEYTNRLLGIDWIGRLNPNKTRTELHRKEFDDD